MPAGYLPAGCGLVRLPHEWERVRDADIEWGRVMGERPHLRVLFMSGYADHAVVQRDIIDAGRPFLQKPFAPDRLVARVKEVLG